MAGRRRPIRGNLLVRGGVIGVGTLRPRHGKVAIKAGARIRVTSGSGFEAESHQSKFVALGVLVLSPRHFQNAAYVSIPLTSGSEVIFRVDGIAAEVLAAQLSNELSSLGADVTVG